jgi:hypothetical protein
VEIAKHAFAMFLSSLRVNTTLVALSLHSEDVVSKISNECLDWFAKQVLRYNFTLSEFCSAVQIQKNEERASMIPIRRITAWNSVYNSKLGEATLYHIRKRYAYFSSGLMSPEDLISPQGLKTCQNPTACSCCSYKSKNITPGYIDTFTDEKKEKATSTITCFLFWLFNIQLCLPGEICLEILDHSYWLCDFDSKLFIWRRFNHYNKSSLHY